jgi:hypothetical protein
VATSAPDALVAAVASRALGDLRGLRGLRGAELGFALERAATLELARQADEDPEADPAVHALLLRATGGLALRPSALVAAAEAAGDARAWAAALREENRALLEDGDPATRARAAGWLAARGELPAGYDPLAPGRARRAALAGS